MADMGQAYQLAAAAVRQRWSEQHPERLAVLEELTPEDVTVYTGQFDMVQDLLAILKIPHEMDVPPQRCSSRILFANCTGAPPQSLASHVESVVREGAWLVSSDWCLQSVVQRAFPQTVRQSQSRNTGDEVVSVEPNRESLWSEVVVLGTDPQWWLETSSYPIEILDPKRVRIDAASHELLVKYGSPAVAVRFDWERGHVFHVISHFWLKRTRQVRGRHGGPCEDFLRDGMKLSDEGIDRVFREFEVERNTLNFATIQSAATSAELVARLCVEAKTASLVGEEL